MKVVLVLLLLCVPMFAQGSDPTHLVSTKTDNEVPNYEPITPAQRMHWFAFSTAGPVSLLLAGPVSAAWGTMLDRPKEYGPHWGGFADRYGMRLTGVSTGNAIEAGVGALWGEDPRYFPVSQARIRYPDQVRRHINLPRSASRWQLASCLCSIYRQRGK